MVGPSPSIMGHSCQATQGHPKAQQSNPNQHLQYLSQPSHQQPLMQVPVAPAPMQGRQMPNVSHVPHTTLAPHVHGGMHVLQQSPPLSIAAAGAAAASTTIAAACGRASDTQQSFQSKQFYGGSQTSNDRPSFRDRARVPPLSMEDVEAEAPNRNVQAHHQGWKASSPGRSMRDRWDSNHQIGLVPDEASSHVPGMVPESTPHPLMPATPDTPGFPKWPMMTPNPMDGFSYSVQNTFINCNIPATPGQPCQSLPRSQSLPRNALRTNDEAPADWSKTEGLAPHPANRLMSAAAAAADPLPGQKAPMTGAVP